jgi:hypothetical protein
MTSNLTLDTLSFNLVYSDKTESLRREVSRGANVPTELLISHREYVDSKRKLTIRSSTVQIDRYVELADGSIGVVTRKESVSYPVDSNVTSTDLLAVVQHGVSLNQEDDSGLDLMDEIFVNREQ